MTIKKEGQKNKNPTKTGDKFRLKNNIMAFV
jgi:hypothetical protein